MGDVRFAHDAATSRWLPSGSARTDEACQRVLRNFGSVQTVWIHTLWVDCDRESCPKALQRIRCPARHSSRIDPANVCPLFPVWFTGLLRRLRSTLPWWQRGLVAIV